MLHLFSDHSRSAFGVVTALQIEGVPFRQIDHAREFTTGVLAVAASDPPPTLVALGRTVPAVFFAPSATLVRDLVGIAPLRTIEGAASISLSEPLWPVRVRQLARAFEVEALRVPLTSLHICRERLLGEVLAYACTADGNSHPAIIKTAHPTRATSLCCLLDLGSALANLLDERYRHTEGRLSVPRAPLFRFVPRRAHDAYYRLPEALRASLQRHVYARLDARLVADDFRHTAYPIDPTGWLLLELIKATIRAVAGQLIRLDRWPAPHGGAAILSHDLEPSRFAYTRGLARLLARVTWCNQPATLGVVAHAGRAHLTEEACSRLRQHDILCHGLEHRGEPLEASSDVLTRQLMAARNILERKLAAPIRGFRSPRLDRSPELLRALDETGYVYDSSYPDVDRENVTHFGGGVRMNVPYRPPIVDATLRVRPSRCLELPVSAPDCIQPLFFGGTLHDRVRALTRAVTEKIRFVSATGGLYVGIVHAGVFGDRDAARRSAHLGFVRRRIRDAGLWLATASQVARWWQDRESVHVQMQDDHVVVTNRGIRPIRGLRLVVEAGDGAPTHVRDLPSLESSQSAHFDLAFESPGTAPSVPAVPDARVG